MFLNEKKMLDSIMSDKGSEELQLCLHLSDKLKSLNFDFLDFLFDVLIFLINFNITLFGSVVSGTGSARLFEEPLFSSTTTTGFIGLVSFVSIVPNVFKSKFKDFNLSLKSIQESNSFWTYKRLQVVLSKLIPVFRRFWLPRK
jgi:hypothetical protein